MRWREVKAKARMTQKPSFHTRRLVGRKVVEHDVDTEVARNLLVECVEELNELDTPMPAPCAADDLAGGYVERGEKIERAVSEVVVRASLRLSRLQREQGLRPLERLNRGLFVDTKDGGVFRRR